MTINTSFKLKHGLRAYEFEDSLSGDKFSLSETPEDPLLFRCNGVMMDISTVAPVLAALFEHFTRFENLPLPEKEAADAKEFQVDSRVTCSGDGDSIFRIAKIHSGVKEGTGSAYLLNEAGHDHGWEDFRKIRLL